MYEYICVPVHAQDVQSGDVTTAGAADSNMTSTVNTTADAVTTPAPSAEETKPQDDEESPVSSSSAAANSDVTPASHSTANFDPSDDNKGGLTK